MKSLITISLLLIASNYYAQNNKDVDYINNYGWIVMEKISVREFVEELKINEKDSTKLNLLSTVGEQNSNWITKEDVSFLITLIDSKKKAKCLKQSISSYIPFDKKTTLGDQAILLIEVYRNQHIFPNKLTHCGIYDDEKRAEIKKWWKEENKQ